MVMLSRSTMARAFGPGSFIGVIISGIASENQFARIISLRAITLRCWHVAEPQQEVLSASNRMKARSPVLGATAANSVPGDGDGSILLAALSPQGCLHLRQVIFGVGDDEQFDDAGHRHLALPEMDAFLAAFRRRHLTDSICRYLNFVVQPAQ